MLIARMLPDAKRWKMFIEHSLNDPDYLKDGDQMLASAKTADGSLDLGQQRNRIVSGGAA